MPRCDLLYLHGIYEQKPFDMHTEAFVLDILQKNIRWVFIGRHVFNGRVPVVFLIVF